MGSYIRVSVIEVYFLEWCVINQTDMAKVFILFFQGFFSTHHAHMKIKVASLWQYQSSGKVN